MSNDKYFAEKVVIFPNDRYVRYCSVGGIENCAKMLHTNLVMAIHLYAHPTSCVYSTVRHFVLVWEALCAFFVRIGWMFNVTFFPANYCISYAVRCHATSVSWNFHLSSPLSLFESHDKLQEIHTELPWSRISWRMTWKRFFWYISVLAEIKFDAPVVLFCWWDWWPTSC